MSKKVSICCAAYNQEKYIEQTIESFLMQKTNFDFEILIYDDASTDNTTEIIKRYEKLYPDMIKPIYQQVNQYTKNVEVNYHFNYKRAKGDYIAYCDGDDYFTDQYKLQKQYDFMESHPDVSAYIHAGKSVTEDGTKILDYKHLYSDITYLNTEEILFVKSSIISNSAFMRNYFTKDYTLPQWYFEAGISDDPLFMYLSTKGTIYYSDEIMCAYRVATKNSWTQRILFDENKRKDHIEKMIQLLKSFNSDTHYIYNEIVQDRIHHNEVEYLMADKNLRKNKPKEFQHIYRSLPMKIKVKVDIFYYFPFVIPTYRKLKSNRFSTMFKQKEEFLINKN